MNHLYDFEDLEDYVLGRMSEADRLAFESAMETDPALRQRVSALQAEQEVLYYLRRAMLKEKFAGWRAESALAPDVKPAPVDQPRPNQKRILWVLLALCCVAAFITGLWRLQWSPTATERKPADPLESPIQAPVLGGDTLLPNEVQPPTDMPHTLPQASAQWQQLGKQAYKSLLKKDGLMGAVHNNLADTVLVLIEQNRLKQATQLVAAADTTQSNVQVALAHLYWLQRNYAAAARWYGVVKNNPDNVRFQLDARLNEIACYIYLLPASRDTLLPLLKPVVEHPEDYSLTGERKNALEAVWKQLKADH